ncbi:hypothetical protein ABPG72_007940 [Tetrahymena utriculariae]
MGCLVSKGKKKKDNHNDQRQNDKLGIKTDQDLLNTQGVMNTNTDHHYEPQQPLQIQKNSIMQQNDKKCASSKDNCSQKQQEIIQQDQIANYHSVQIRINRKDSKESLSNCQIGNDHKKNEKCQQNNVQAQSLSQNSLTDQNKISKQIGIDVISNQQNNIQMENQLKDDFSLCSQTKKQQENKNLYEDKLSKQNSFGDQRINIEKNQNLFQNESELNNKKNQQKEKEKQDNNNKEVYDFIKSQNNVQPLIQSSQPNQNVLENSQIDITNTVNIASQIEQLKQFSNQTDDNSKTFLNQNNLQLDNKIVDQNSQNLENGTQGIQNLQELLSAKTAQKKQDNLDQLINIDNKLSENQKDEQPLNEINIDRKENNISEAFSQFELDNNNNQISSNIISHQSAKNQIDAFSSYQQEINQNNNDKQFKSYIDQSTQFPDETFANLVNQQQKQDPQKTEVKIEGEENAVIKQEKQACIKNEAQTQIKYTEQIQDEEKIEISQDELIETEQMYTDEEFPPKIESIAYDQVAYLNKLLEKQTPLVFKRVSEVIKAGVINLFFNNTTSIFDVKQGMLGDCYFIVCMIVLSQYPNVIKSLFKNQSYNEKGKYILNLIKNGKPIRVVVDDYLPCYQDSRGFAFAQSPNNIAIWPSLLEKAIAKLHKNYINIEGNNESKLGPSTSAVFMHLVGCPSQLYYFDNSKTNSYKDIEEAWAKTQESFNKGYLQTTGVSKSDFTGEKQLENGLVANHAYSILEVRQFGQQKLIKLKNPWAKTEWKLDWSDESTCWTEELKQKVNLEVKDDGVFWMSFEDFYQNFSYVSVAFFNPNYQYSFLEIKNEEYFALFQYDLYVEEAGEDIEGSLILSQIGERYLLDQNQSTFKSSSISFCVFEMDEESNKPTKLKYTVCQNSEMIFQQVKFERGKKYSIMIIVDFLRSYQKDIVLSFYGNQKINFQKKNLIRKAQFKIFCDYIETVKKMESYDEKWPIYKYQIRIGSIFVFAIRNNTNNQRFINEIEITSCSLVTDCLKYNEPIEYQEIENKKYKVIVPSCQTLKWIFKQSSFVCNNVSLGMSQKYRVLPEKFLSDEEIENQIQKDSEKILVSEGIDGQISMFTLNLSYFLVYKYVNTTKDKTYVQRMQFITENMRFLNSNDFEMDDQRYHKIIVPPSQSIYLKFEQMIIDGITSCSIKRSQYQYQLI